MKETIGSRKAILLLSIYLLILLLITFVIWPRGSHRGWEMGMLIFYIFSSLSGWFVTFVTPALTASAFTREKEAKTIDLLRVTPLTSRSIIFGKITGPLLYVFLAIFASLPFLSITFLIGGVSPVDVVLFYLSIMMSAVFYGTVGAFLSLILKRTLHAIIVSYITIFAVGMAVSIGSFFIMFMGIGVVGSTMMYPQASSSPMTMIAIMNLIPSLFYLVIAIILLVIMIMKFEYFLKKE